MLAFVSQLSKYACLWLKQHWTPHSLESVMRSPRTTNPDFKDSAEINDLNGLWETCHGFISCLPSFGVCLDSQVRNLCSHSPPSVGYFWWVIYREVSAVLLALFPFLSSSSFSLTLFLSLSLFPSLFESYLLVLVRPEQGKLELLNVKEEITVQFFSCRLRNIRLFF